MLKAANGFVIGVMFTLIMVAIFRTKKEHKYRCKVNMFEACNDICCRYCLGHKECKYNCGGDPSMCGQSIKIE